MIDTNKRCVYCNAKLKDHICPECNLLRDRKGKQINKKRDFYKKNKCEKYIN